MIGLLKNLSRMKKIIIFVIGIMVMILCIESSLRSEKDVSLNITGDPDPDFSMYGQVDSTFNIQGKTFTVQVKQFDLTDIAILSGDTITRPTFTCAVRIVDEHDKVIFADSILRDSWAYPGKMVSIDAYQIAFPQLKCEGNEIVLSFNVFEHFDGDAITGSIAFDIKTNEARYFWQESLEDDSQ
jgi:hypothetical protein